MATVTGTTGNDTLTGTSGNDTISGLGGNDLIQAGSTGGTDLIDGGAGTDSIEFRERATTGIVVNFVAGTITGGTSGSISFTNVERVVATNFDDTLTGNATAQTLTGQGGADTLWGAGGIDTLWGGGGADTFVFREIGTAQADRINDWTSGSDKLLLDASVMTALGTAGNFTAGDARFKANSTGTATDASDRIIYNTTTREIFYDADGNGSGARVLIATLQSGATLVATDIIVEGGGGGGGNQTINGTSGNDSLVGGAGNDTINGFAGEDTIDGGPGADSMVGGAQPDTYFVDNAGDIIVELEDGGFDTVNASVSYTLPAWVNHLTLTGTAALNGTGNELPNGITGNSGANVLAGRDGNDTLTGDGGADSFLFNVAPGTANADSLVDFTSGQDKVTLDGNFHASAGASGNFAAGDARFWSSTSGAAHDVDDRVIYNTSTGQLWYDADGTGGGAAQLIATLQGAPSLAASDIAIINGSGGGGGGPVINGTSGNDVLVGGDGAEAINGLAGNDTLSGGGGNDTVNGGDGLDRLTGGAGADDFAFTSDVRSFNSDVITDFVSGIDRLNLEPARFDLIGAGGRFAVDDERFYAAARLSGAHDATDRVLYDTESGAVLYDLDGNGPGVAILVARLEGAPTLAATDIFVDTKTTQPAPSVRTVQQTGSSDNRIDVVIIGDGYTASEISTVYAQHVDGLTAYMFNDSLLSQPFGRYESFFNIYAIELVSNESGTDNRATGELRDTALDSFHDGDRLIIADSSLADEAVADALAGTGIAVDMRFMPVNTTLYGGAGSFYPTFSAGNFWANEIALHEQGHSFAGLADQYFSAGHWSGSEPSQPDVTTDASGAKWAQWVGYDQPGIGVIGAYEGGLYNETGIYRPSENSKMRSLGQPFDAVGREQFVLEFYQFVDPLDAWLNNASTLTDVDELWVDAIDADIISVDWTINGTTYVDAGERISLSALGYFDGQFTVTARAYDPTDWVRVADRSSLEQRVLWTVVNDETGGGGEDRVLTGTSGNDSLVGTAGNDTINGLGGNDTLVGSGGSDVYDGGAGSDTLDLRAAATGATVSLAAGTLSGGFNGTLANMERVLASNLDDNLIGTGGGQNLSGQGGADTLWGATGVDTLWGGGGADVFIFREMGSTNADRISDWASGSDKVHLDDAAFAAIGAMGNFAAADARFKANSTGTATDTSDRVVYNTSTGQLYYDADGSGGGSAQIIATFVGNPTVAATDFAVI